MGDEAQDATADTLLDHFWDVDHGGVFTTPDDGETLVARQKDVYDNATPSANSMAALGLYRLAGLTGEMRYSHQADRILQLLGGIISQSPSGFSHALAAIDLHLDGPTEIAVVGDRPDLRAVVDEAWRPNSVVAWGEPYESPLWDNRQDGHAYVCRNFACQAPQTTPDGLRAQLRTRPDPARSSRRLRWVDVRTASLWSDRPRQHPCDLRRRRPGADEPGAC